MRFQSKRKKRKTLAKFHSFLILGLLAGLFFIVFMLIPKVGAKLILPKPSSAALNINTTASSLTADGSGEQSISEIEDTQDLVLVNTHYAIKDDTNAASLVRVSTQTAALDSTIELRPEALHAVAQLISGTQNAVGGSLYVSSGFRDYTSQKEVYADETDKTYAQTPGHSEHETGLAADIMVKGVAQYAEQNTPQAQWMAQNAWRYGLIVRYEAGKEGSTGISYEPWHFRYIGEVHAWYCTQHQLSLEEYIAFLKKSGGYSMTLNGTRYTISYETAKNGHLKVPTTGHYNISSDNTGGYIVTAWA
jgi:D-alanyl-D-alanine carboxypeptidase